MDRLKKAIRIAAKIHTGYKGKQHEPAILHSLRVMLQMESNTTRIVAVLHDTVETGKITIKEIADAGFSEKVCKNIDLLSRKKRETYDHYIYRIHSSKIAVKVKLADLIDNYHIRNKYKKHSKMDIMKMKRYRRAYKFLTGDQLPGSTNNL